MDDADTIGQPRRFIEIMSDQQGRHRQILPKVGQFTDQAVTGDAIDRREGLVEKQDIGTASQRPRHRDALLLPPGKLPRQPVFEPVETDAL